MDQIVSYPVRLFFKKEGRACYISHLDLSRCMSRAIIRSGIPARYTMGFNPHLYRTFALPLSLGVEGKMEICDIKLTDELPFFEISQRLNNSLPEGIEIIKAAKPVLDPKEIMWADYSVFLDCDSKLAAEAVGRLKARDEINVDKKTKKGIKQQNIRELFTDLEITGEGFKSRIDVRCRAGVETNLNPSLILDALNRYEGFEPYFTKTARNRLLTKDFALFE